MKLAEGMVACLLEHEVKTVFGLPGGALLPLWAAFEEEPQIQVVTGLHEQLVTFMADGFARLNGDLGVVLATTGPGTTNTLTGVATAFSDHVPLLVLSAQVNSRPGGRLPFQDGSGHHIDVVETLKSSTKRSIRWTIDDSLERFREAILLALEPPYGPVHLNVPADFFEHSVVSTRVQRPSVVERVAPREPKSERHILEAVEILAHAKRPVVLAGAGVLRAAASEPLMRLASILQAPIATTPKGKSAIPETHQLAMGVFGFPGHRSTIEQILSSEIDALVVVGSRLGEWSSLGWEERLWKGRRVVQIDTGDGAAYPPEASVLKLQGDAHGLLSILADRLELQDLIPRGWTTAGIQKPSQVPSTFPETGKGADPRIVVAWINDLLQGDHRVFLDIGNVTSWGVVGLEAKAIGQVSVNLGFGCMGHAGPAAIGSALSHRGGHSVAIMGDGAFAMSCAALHTAAQKGISATWIVFNDGGYGMLDQVEEALYSRPVTGSRFSKPIDVVSIAQGFGARARTAEGVEEFRTLFHEAPRISIPTVIDVLVDPSIVPEPLKYRVGMLSF